MTDQQMRELKAYFKAEITQSGERLEARLGARIDALEAKVDNGFQGVAEALNTIIEIMDQDRKHTNQRLTRLERHVFGI